MTADVTNERQRFLTAGVVVVSAYIAAQILSDIASLRIVTLAGLSMDAGTLLYPVTFTLRDVVHKLLGKRAARTTIFAAGGINLFMAAFFWLVASLPADPQVGPQAEFAAILAPVWRIVFASIAAEVFSELIDTEAYQFWVDRMGRRRQWARVVFSNGVAIPVDSLLFSFLAFYGVYGTGVVWGIVIANIAVKVVTTVVSIPLIYAVPERVEN